MKVNGVQNNIAPNCLSLYEKNIYIVHFGVHFSFHPLIKLIDYENQ